MNYNEREQLERKLILKRELKRRKQKKKNDDFSIYGIVNKEREVVRCWQDSINGIKEVSKDLEATVLVPEKIEKLVTVNKRYKAVIGGRGSGKSVTINKILVCKAKDKKVKVACFREFMNSISESTYSGLVDEIEELGFENFKITSSNIDNESNNSSFLFKGLARNVQSVKSMNGINIAFTDEAQTISDISIKVLKPTIREDNSELWFAGNPESSADPFSKEFITKYQKVLDRDGIYEDSHRLVIVCNYYDNPFFPSVLENERLEDLKNLPRPIYDWIWLGKFLDTVDNPVIQPEWFDSAIDMHKLPQFKKLMRPKGAIIASHDVSDNGDDSKGYACRHGSVITSVKEKVDGDISDGAQWAIKLSLSDSADIFTFDASGMGVGIRKEVNESLRVKRIQIDEHRGGDRPDDFDKIYEGFDQYNKNNNKKNSEIFRNKRAQYIWRLRDRFYNSYKAVVKGEYINPDDCISLCSEGIDNIEMLRSEICRQPLKNNASGLIQMMSKSDMKKIGIQSPNLLDSVAMTMITPKPPEEEWKDLDYEELHIV
jgi:phage terminase large subunit